MDDSHPDSLVPGGPYHALAKRVRLVRDDAGDALRQSIAFGLVPWCVLMAIAFGQRIASGHWPELISTLSVHARLLVAIPAFFLTERSLRMRTRRCLDWLCDEEFLGSGRAELDRETARITRLRDAVAPELLMLVLVIANSGFVVWGADLVSGTLESLSVPLKATASGIFYGLVGLPLFQFFGLRCLWRWTLWIGLLRRISRLDLRPIANHPDEQGGLAFLAEPAIGFCYFCFGASSVLAAARVTRFGQGAQVALTLGTQVLLAVAVAVVLTLGPLVWFFPVLWRARFEAVRSYGGLASRYTRDFRRRWIDGRGHEGLLGTPDLQSLADLANSYDVLARSNVVPITRRALIVVALSVVVPFGLVLLTQVPVVELLNEMGSTVFGPRLFRLPGQR